VRNRGAIADDEMNPRLRDPVAQSRRTKSRAPMAYRDGRSSGLYAAVVIALNTRDVRSGRPHSPVTAYRFPLSRKWWAHPRQGGNGSLRSDERSFDVGHSRRGPIDLPSVARVTPCSGRTIWLARRRNAGHVRRGPQEADRHFGKRRGRRRVGPRMFSPPIRPVTQRRDAIGRSWCVLSDRGQPLRMESEHHGQRGEAVRPREPRMRSTRGGHKREHSAFV
jgi:hypothetical protein